MNGHDAFSRWARLARRDEPEPVDVTHAVMARIASAGPARPEPVDRMLLAFALGSLAAAALVATLVVALDPSLADPLADLLQSVSPVMQ
ncbi:MAG: hypothetical protein ACYTG2_11175 [Planctomycetota bacterium]